MKKTLLLLLSFLLFGFSWAKDAYNIKVKINNLSFTNIQLAYYYGDKQYVKQEALTDGSGVVVFKGDTALPAGIYLIVLPQSKYFEVLVEEQFFSVEVDYNGDEVLAETLKAEKSPQNTAFFQHNKLMKEKREEADALKKLKEIYSKDPNKKAEVEDINKKLGLIDDEVLAKQNAVIKENKGKLVSKLLLAAKRPQIPEEITDKTARFYYYRAHFWEDFDFNSTGLLYSPLYQPRINEYLVNLTVADPDSVFQSADYIIGLTKKNKEFYKYTVIWMVNNYAKTKNICFESIYVNLVYKYYASGEADWADEEQVKKMVDNATGLSRVLCNQKAGNIVAKSESYATPSLFNVKAKYTAVFIWDADCWNCKIQAKELKEVYETYKEKGFTVYSVDVGSSKEKWQKYSAEQALPWINLYNDAVSTNVKEVYNIKATPKLFLLDENKTILFNQLDAKQVEEYLESNLD